jgi:hypothetical protein
MHFLTSYVSSVIPTLNVDKEPKNTESHEMEPNPSKDKGMNEGYDPFFFLKNESKKSVFN